MHTGYVVRAEFTRPLRLAGPLTGASESTLLERLQSIEIGVCVESAREDLVATAQQLLVTIGRLPARLALDPAGMQAAQVEALRIAVAQIAPDRPLRFGDVNDSAVTARVGHRADGVDVVVLPVLHGARVGRLDLPAGPRGSGLGVVFAGALGAGEMFKIAAEVIGPQGVRHDRLSFCPVTLTDRPQDGPPLPDLGDLDLAVVGLGAVGTATARILSLLPAGGRMLLVDPERFGPENLGTYSLGSADDAEAQTWKVDIAAAALSGFSCQSFSEPIEQVIEHIDAGDVHWPRTVLSGLDSVTARRQVQRLWPDQLVDGATAETMCGLHHVVAGDGACLMCLFPVRTEGPSAAERLSQVLGLPADVLRYGDQLVTQEHVDHANPAQRATLEEQVGKPICGLARAVGLTALADDGYMPSVSFVSQQAACLTVGRLIAQLAGVSGLPRFVQYDALSGPEHATLDDRRAESSCFCQQRAPLVERVRVARASSG